MTSNNVVKLPPMLTNALDVIGPLNNYFNDDEIIKSSCCFLPCVSTKVSPTVDTAIKSETKVFDEMVKEYTNTLTTGTNHGRIVVNNKQLAETIQKYKEVKGRTEELITHYRALDKAQRCFCSIFCSSYDVRAAIVRDQHVGAHLNILLELQKTAKTRNKQFTQCKDRLEEISLTIAPIKNTTLVKVPLEMLRKSTVSLLDKTTVKVNDKAINAKKSDYVSDRDDSSSDDSIHEQDTGFSKLIKKINEALDVNEEARVTEEIVKVFSSTEGKITKTVKETPALRLLKFCSNEAYVHLVTTLNNHFTTTYPGHIVPDYDGKGKIQEVSIVSEDNTTSVTSLASIFIKKESTNLPICKVEATLKATIDQDNNVMLGCTFDGLELLGSAVLADEETLKKAFGHK